MSIIAPRFVISSLSGGGGKTLLSLGLCNAFTQKGSKVKPFKKGPDYIDSMWLAEACQTLCTNLDLNFVDDKKIQSLFAHALSFDSYDLAIIEGNRGLFDGLDVQGSCATSELARILKTPIILSLNVTKMTRTSAALIQGLINFEDDLDIAGVVLNQVGSARHESIVRASIEHYTNIPVLGSIPRLKDNPLPEKHMGLCQCNNHSEILNVLGEVVTESCDIQRIYDIALSASMLPQAHPFWETPCIELNSNAPRIGHVYDEAFWFYYVENLEALARAGAEIVPLSVLDPSPWPTDLHGLYLGGGYPEDFAAKISGSPHLAHIKAMAENNMPIYAECGGFMLLASELVRDDVGYPMAGVFPVHTHFHKKPQGLGYVQAKVSAANPFHPEGQIFKGHEFHYSHCLPDSTQPLHDMFCLQLDKGVGMGRFECDGVAHYCDGLTWKNTFAAYTHIYAPACPWWAQNFVALAQKFAQEKNRLK